MAVLGDVAPDLLSKIRADFESCCAKDSKVQTFMKRIADGRATQDDCSLYARRIGELLSDSFLKFITADALPDGKMYYNIADRIVTPMLNNNYRLVNTAAAQVQTAMDKKAGIQIKPQTGKRPDERIHAIVDSLTDPTADIDAIRDRLGEPVRNTSQSYFDDYVQTNMEFRTKSGLTQTLTRTAETKCCQWCADLAGSWVYGRDDIPEDVYRRHDNCRCTVTYRTEKRLDVVHSGKEGKRTYVMNSKGRYTNNAELTRFTAEQAEKMERSLSARYRKA